MKKRRLATVLVLGQAVALLMAGGVTFWYSQELMLWLIHQVGEEQALGSGNVVHLDFGAKLLTNPGAMVFWMLPIWMLGFVHITSAVSLVILWLQRRANRNAQD